MSVPLNTSVYQFINESLDGKQCAVFDMDDTLISGAYTNLYSYPGAKEKLVDLVKQGYNLIIISNQKKPNIKEDMIKAKIEAVIKFYQLPMHFFCAREDDTKYRKPYIGILDLIPTTYGAVKYFVGDAAGREGDHSDCDILFAKNANIPFFTPEEFFNPYPVVGSEEIPKSIKLGKVNFLTMVILCGFPASGKSTYATKVLDKFHRINRDELKTIPKCIKVANEKLSNNINVVIDNLNSTIKSRSEFIKLAQQKGAIIVVIWMRITMYKAMERNKKRIDKVSNVVFYTYRKNFQMPTLKEEIDEIYSIL